MATINITALDSATASEVKAGMSLLGWKSDKTLKAVPTDNLASSIIDEFKLAQYVGPLDVTGSNYTHYLPTSATSGVRLATAADASGNTSGGYAVCSSGLASLIHPSDSRGAAVNLGDLLLFYWDSNAAAAKVKVIPFGEAKKPADAGGVGTYGQMVPNDKEKLDQCVTDIDQTCFRCYSGEYNMNYCGWYGYYMHGTLGRPAGSADGEYYVLRVANGGTDGDYVVLEQTAYSCQDPARVFRRIVKTKDRSAMGADGNTTWGEWTQIGWVDLTEVTYAELVALRDAGELEAGAQYRITDYVATTTAANTMSAGHQFDIIVTALSGSVLSETARAALHDGDTYFANSKLEAWELSYSLDNDTTRFAWADAENGKGVVYRLKDEWNNDCPYDFKGILFKRWKITATTTAATDLVGYYYAYATSMTGFAIDSADYIWAYTFNINDGDGGFADASLCLDTDDPTKNNRIEEYSPKDQLPRVLNNIVFGVYIDETDDAAEGNTFRKNCLNMTFGNECRHNSFGNGCRNNSFGNGCYGNSFGNECYGNSFGNECYYNSFGNGCRNNSFDAYARWIIVDGVVRYVTLTSSDEGSDSSYIQYVHICQGVCGTSESSKEISVTRALAYQTEVKKAGSVTMEV